jgi:hypothetical protein
MTDAYVYFFLVRNGSSHEQVRSLRRATLDAIKGRGEPLMESQIVVDHTELDANGFVRAGAGREAFGVGELTAQIKSIELRAVSRDLAALKLDERTQGKEIYMLSLESRELRLQAKLLKKRRAEMLAAESSSSQVVDGSLVFE